MLPWALAAVVASGGALWSLSLLSMALLVRVSVALTVGVGILRDGQVLRDFWLLSGERFRLKRGVLQRIEDRV
jgi:ceramide glucosyltransferase